MAGVRGRVGVEEFVDRLDVERAGVEEALAVVALLVLECGELGVGFDPFGEGLEVEAFAESHEGVDKIGGASCRERV